MISSIGNSGNTMATTQAKQTGAIGATDGSTGFQDILSNLNNIEKVTISAADKNKCDFVEWKVNYCTKGIGEDRRIQVEADSAPFQQIIDKAVANGGYGDPQTFVSNLSSAELAVLQHIHCLAEPIIPKGLSKEGALNLLYSPDQSKDINNDGLSDIGIAKMWKFPPPNAPEAVKKAWAEATKGKDILLISAPFMTAEANANVKPDGSGIYFPGEPGYRNIYAEPGFSYTRQITDILKSWEHVKPSNYYEAKEFLNTFLGTLNKYYTV